ncbi:hypothetical protein [Anaerobacillus sp. CMMVII]|uniref:hypothetical protein n=1 Tax=Anaerobacillus sp. CMMVII TaxID=2755588 RepID=UPI0021B72B91|nr:hypothetical protein [Anaerobacillus sp. CMMVII]
MPEKDLEKFINPTKDEVYELSNGSKAYYRRHHEDFHTLVFQRSGFGYLFGGSTTDHYDLDVLIETAESIK